MANKVHVTRFRFPLVLCVAFAGLTAFGCAHAVAPRHVRYADINNGALQGYTGAEPLIIEFQPGDRLPVNFEFTGEDFELQPRHPSLELVAKQHGFLRISAKGIRVSRDPDHFDIKPSQPGSFRVGFSAAQGKPAKLDVAIVAPRR
jgi:hypothetical protein